MLATKASRASCQAVGNCWEVAITYMSNSQCKLRHRLIETRNIAHKQHQIIVSFAQRMMLVMTFVVSLALRVCVSTLANDVACVA